MSEMALTWIAGVKLVIAALIGLLYSLAGRGVSLPILGKIRRRIWLPAILCFTWLISMFIKGAFTWLLLGAIGLSFPLYFLTMSVFSYGADSWIRRLVGRIPQQFIVGAVHGGSCILVALVVKLWGIYSLSVLVPCISLGVLGGIADKDMPAAWKEAVTGMVIFLYPLFLI